MICVKGVPQGPSTMTKTHRGLKELEVVECFYETQLD